MPILDATDGVDAHSLFVFLDREERRKKEKQYVNGRQCCQGRQPLIRLLARILLT